MSECSSHQLALKSAKRQAHRLSKEKNITKGEALELLSKSNGFLSWQSYRDHLLENGDKRRERIDIEDFDSSVHDKFQIRGFFPDGDSARIQIRTSYISLIGNHYENTGQLRTYFDKTIKKILSRSKKHAFIFILIHMDSRVKYPFLDEDGFFKSLFDRYDRLSNIQTRYLDRHPSFEEIQAWIQEKENFYDFHIKECQKEGGILESFQKLKDEEEAQ